MEQTFDRGGNVVNRGTLRRPAAVDDRLEIGRQPAERSLNPGPGGQFVDIIPVRLRPLEDDPALPIEPEDGRDVEIAGGGRPIARRQQPPGFGMDRVEIQVLDPQQFAGNAAALGVAAAAAAKFPAGA